MFGFVMADMKELSREQRLRYNGIYCGICRRIRTQSSPAARMGLSYDMAFLALLHTSLYEPEEEQGRGACRLHPIRPRPWVDNPYIAYCADMNVALAYYKAMDDYRDEGKRRAKLAADMFGKSMDAICSRYPRQCGAMAQALEELAKLERENCQNPDAPANCFGRLMGELFVYREDHWSELLRQMGMALGRFIYLADGIIDYRTDSKKKTYNPWHAMGSHYDRASWEQYLVLAMARCTECFERLPLVQDKEILDNILYSGIWIAYRSQIRGEKK